LSPPRTASVDLVDLVDFDPLGEEPVLPESLRLLAQVGTDDDPYAEGGPWAYANETGGRCFWVMQYAEYQPTAQTLLTDAQVQHAVNRKGVTRWAYAWHDRDTVTEDDVKRDPALVLDALKSRHCHVAELRKSFATIAQVARAYGVAPERVEVKPPSAFLDMVAYLDHSGEHQQAEGKFLYPADAVHANFDWGGEVAKHRLARKEGQPSLTPRDQLRQAVMHGEMTLKQAREQRPIGYANDLPRLRELWADFMRTQPSPPFRLNAHISGGGKMGKSPVAELLARALADVLFPDLDYDDAIYWAGSPAVALQHYRGQPIIVWNEYRAVDFFKVFAGRSGIFSAFDVHPLPFDVHMLYGDRRLSQVINIITNVNDPAEFMSGLAGTYKNRHGETIEAEDVTQAWGRFPLFLAVRAESVECFVNAGFEGSGPYTELVPFAQISVRVRDSKEQLGVIEDDVIRAAEERAFAGLLTGSVVEKCREIMSRKAIASTDADGEPAYHKVIVVDGDDLTEKLALESAEKLRVLEADAERRRGENNRARVVADRIKVVKDFCTCGGGNPYAKPSNPYKADHERGCPAIERVHEEMMAAGDVVSATAWVKRQNDAEARWAALAVDAEAQRAAVAQKNLEDKAARVRDNGLDLSVLISAGSGRCDDGLRKNNDARNSPGIF